MTSPGTPIAIAPLADAKALAHLHALCFERPWSAESFANLLSHPGVSALAGCLGETPAGFILTRRAADEAEILTIGVVSEARRQGVARALFEAVMKPMSDIRSLFIEVDVTNIAALRFYEVMGFQTAGRRKDYYQHTDGTKSDALIMRFDLASSTSG